MAPGPRPVQAILLMKRRRFCRQFVLVSGGIALTPLMNRCAPDVDPDLVRDEPLPTTEPASTPGTPQPTPSPRPAATATPDLTGSSPPAPENVPREPGPLASPARLLSANVALVKTADRALGVRQALKLLAVNPVRGQRVLLKPNYNSADAAPASTHPDTLRSLVFEMNEMGARSITVGERSGMGDTRAVLTQTGVFGLADELGFDTVLFDELEDGAWQVLQSRDFHWASGFAVPRILLDSECVVQTCNLKTHRYGGHFTLSLKNSVGFVARTVSTGSYNYMEELHRSPYQRRMIAEINAAYEPALILLDGVDAFVAGGPATGKVVSPSVVLAGTDPVAIDAVGVAILRLFGTTPEVSRGSVFEQEQIARAVELGLGIDAPERIQLVTGDAESAELAGLIRYFLR